MAGRAPGPAATRARLADALAGSALMSPGVLATLVEALGNGVLLLDPDHRVAVVNTAFLRLVGVSARPDELVGVTLDGTAPQVHVYMNGKGTVHTRTSPGPTSRTPTPPRARTPASRSD